MSTPDRRTSKPHHHHPVARAVVLLLLATGLIALGLSSTVHGALISVLEASRGVIAAHPVAGPIIFVLLAAVSAFMSFVSSAVLIPAAVYAWGPLPTMLLLWVGWTLGGAVAHSLAYYFGRPLLHWLAAPESVERYERLLERHTSFGEILLFQMALPSELVGYGLGLARCPLGRYLAALAVAQLPYAAGTVLISVGFVQRDFRTMIMVSAVGIIAIVVLARIVQRRLNPASDVSGDDPSRAETPDQS